MSQTKLSSLFPAYRFSAGAEGKTQKTIITVLSAVGYLEEFLSSEGLTPNAEIIGVPEIRAFIVCLQQKRRFSSHRYARPQPGGLSGHTINSYLRSIRAFWSWLVSEGIIADNPFAGLSIPRAPVKIIPTFSEPQIRALLEAINTTTPEGFRDLVIILTLLDSGLRVTELANLQLDDLHLEEGTLKVLGKGNRERLIPIGKQVRHYLLRYLNYCRLSQR
ncbi:tyrosine-type recombinase/integrase [Chloroflexota bacterium]